MYFNCCISNQRLSMKFEKEFTKIAFYFHAFVLCLEFCIENTTFSVTSNFFIFGLSKPTVA